MAVMAAPTEPENSQASGRARGAGWNPSRAPALPSRRLTGAAPPHSERHAAVIQTPQDLLVYALQEIQDAETQASQAVQNQLQLIENEELGKLLQRRLEQGGRLLRDVSQSLQA